VVSSCLPLVLDALQPRHILKPNSALAPFPIFGQNIFGNKDDLCGPADERALFGVGFRCDQRKHGTAIGRGDRYPALTRCKADIADQTEPQMVQVESQALILIANEDVNRVDTEMGMLQVWRKSILVCGNT
jgi:hypothetical protein